MINDLKQEIKYLMTCPHYPLFVIDLFCGAGGVTVGIENAKVNNLKCAKVVACVNHDKNAIKSHAANHKDTLHYTEDITTLDTSGLQEIVKTIRTFHTESKIWLHASVECTNFSKAKGGMSRDADSRTLAEHLFRYVKVLRPEIITIENVEEFMTWGPLIEKKDKNGNTVMVKKSSGTGKSRKIRTEPALLPDPKHAGEYYRKWVNNMCSYGYTFEYRILNSADYGAYTSRRRFFGMFVAPGIPMVFPEPTHARNPNKTLFGEELKPWKAVRDVLDLDDGGQSIFDRKKPLVDATLRRIKAGLVKFVAGGDKAFLTKAFSGNPKEKCTPLSAPAGTVTTIDHHQFVSTYYKHGENHSIGGPAPTVTTKDRISLVSVIEERKRLLFLDNQYGNGAASSVDRPCGTVTANPKQKIVEAVRAPWLMNTSFNNVGSSIDKPCQVVTANRKWHYIVNPQFSDSGASIDRPCPTVIARQDKKPLQLAQCRTHGPLPSFVKEAEDGTLIYEIYDHDSETLQDIKKFMCLYGIVDITIRMLRIKELKLIQGFPEDYVLVGTQEEQKKYLGNAVVTIMAKALCEALAGSLDKRNIKTT